LTGEEEKEAVAAEMKAGDLFCQMTSYSFADNSRETKRLDLSSPLI
jgi:hypothetical protein